MFQIEKKQSALFNLSGMTEEAPQISKKKKTNCIKNLSKYLV